MSLKIIKIFIFMCAVLVVSATNLKAEWNETKWKLKCNEEQKNCQIGILNKVFQVVNIENYNFHTVIRS